MIRQSTVDLLREMRLGGMASELERQISDAESFRELSFEDRLALLVDAEWNRRQKNKYQKRTNTRDAFITRDCRFRTPLLKGLSTMRIGS